MSASIYSPDAEPATIGEVMRGEKVYVTEDTRMLPVVEIRADNIYFSWSFSRFFMGKFGDGACIGFTYHAKKMAFYFGLEKEPLQKEGAYEFLVEIVPPEEGYLVKVRSEKERQKLEAVIQAFVTTYKLPLPFKVRFESAKRTEMNLLLRTYRIWHLVKTIL